MSLGLSPRWGGDVSQREVGKVALDWRWMRKNERRRQSKKGERKGVRDLTARQAGGFARGRGGRTRGRSEETRSYFDGAAAF